MQLQGEYAHYFTVSVDTLQRDEVNKLAGRNIHIGYKPAQIGAHTAILSIAGGGLESPVLIQLQGDCIE